MALIHAVAQRRILPVVLIIQKTAWLTIKAGADAPQEEQSPVAVFSALHSEDCVAHSTVSATNKGRQILGTC